MAAVATRLGSIILETSADARREVAKLIALARQVSELPDFIPLTVLEKAADAITWQKIRLARAIDGRDCP